VFSWQNERWEKVPIDFINRLKAKTPTGIKKGAAQLRRYEEAFNKKGRIVYYDPTDY
jgi:hypothetical protein